MSLPTAAAAAAASAAAPGLSLLLLLLFEQPRFAGDAEDPRGGVRWVLPEHAAYWERT